MDFAALVAKISLDTTEYDNGLNNAQGKLKTFGSKLQSGFNAVVKTGGKLLAGASGAVLAFGASSVKTGMDFDQSMSQVAATMGKTTDEIKDLRDFAQEMGRTTQFSASQAADALNYMALAGYDAEKSMGMLPNVLNLAAAGAMDLAQASDMVTDASSALGLSTEQTEAMVDQMAQTASKSNTSVAQLGSAMLTVGGTAKVLRGGTVELATALGLLADNGTKGAEGGTALRNVLTTIQGQKFEKTFGQMGVEAYDAQGKLRSLKDIFLEMNQAMEGMTDEEKTSLINKTFNARDLKNVNALLGTSAERWDELTASIEDSQGAAEKMAETQMDNLAGDITYFKSALEGAQIAISDGLSPALRKFVQEGTDGMSRFAEAVQSGDLSKAMEVAGETIAKLATLALSKVPDLIAAGMQLLSGIGKGFLAAAPALITSIGASINSMLDSVLGALSGGDVGGSFGGMFDSLQKMAEAAVQGLQTIIPKMVEIGVQLATRLGEGLESGIPMFLAKALPLLSQFAEWLRANAGTLIDAGLTMITNIAQGIINSLPVLIAYVPTIVTNIANIINDNAPKIVVTGVTIIGNLIKGLISAIPTLVANIPQIVQAIFAVWMAVNWVDLGTSVVTFIKDGIKSISVTIPQTLREIGQTAMEWFTAINWASVGSDVIDLILIGIESLSTAIPNLLKAIGKTAIDFFRAVNWAAVGRAALSLVAGGIKGAAGLVKSAIKGPVDYVKSHVKSGFEKAKESAVKAFEKLKTGVSKAIDKAKDAVQKAVNKIKSFFPIKIGKIIGNIRLPKFTLSSASKTFMGKTIHYPTGIHLSWHKKAMEEPFMFSKATLFGAGEAGDEVLYGRKALMNDITTAMENAEGGGKTVNIYNYITIDGAENPEDFADRLIRKIETDMRIA